MHSPFVFDFILHVLNNGKGYAPPHEIEILRKQLLHDHTSVAINDLGAGSGKLNSASRTVASIAASALKPPRLAQLLFRLVRHYQPKTIIELGTSLGITTAYLASGNLNAEVITIEGSEAVAERAGSHLKALRLDGVKIITGNFDERLPQVLQSTPSVDLAYIDGNHRYEPTLRYFNQLLPHLDEHSILVFDDIHWSPQMESAWEAIQQHPSVVYTIDIFFLGFVFFRKDFKVKQHFTIRF